MILLYILISLISLCYGQNAALSFKCPEAGEDFLTIEAVYSGTGTPPTVIWTYSGASLTVLTSGCTVFGSVPAGFIDSSRLKYKCVTTNPSLPANTYQLLVSDLQDDILGKTWAVTFTPPGAAAPPPVSSDAPSKCSGTTSTTLSSSSTNITITNTATTIPSSTKFSTTNSPGEDICTTVPPPTAPTSPPTPSTTIKSPIVIIVPSVVGVFVIVIICIIVCILLRKRSNREKKYRADQENEEMPQVDINEVDINVIKQQ